MTRHLSFCMFALALAACEGQKSDPDATGSARVTGLAQGGDHGRTSAVAVYRIEADGSLSEVSTGEASVEADGHYSVDIAVDEGGARNLVVEATFEDGLRLDGLISAPVFPGDTAEAEPIGQETNAEADLTVSLIASGAFQTDDEEVSLVRAFVDERVGAAWLGDGEEARAGVTGATTAAILAWQHSAEQGEHATTALNLYVAALAQASAESVESGEDQAIDAMGMLLSSYEAAGTSTLDLSLAANASFEAWQHSVGSAEGEGLDAGADLLAALRVTLMTEVVAASWSEIDAEGDGEDLEARGDALVEEVIDLLVGGESDEEADEVVSDYASEVVTALSLALGGELTAEIATAEAMTFEARGELSAAVEAASDDAETSAEQISDAVAAYDLKANVAVAAWLSASGGFDEAEASAVAQILSQLTLTSGE